MVATNSAQGTLQIIPLGGLGEIGLNCMVLEYEGYALAIDCGVLFPDPTLLGIDLVIPDFSVLERFGEKFLGFVLTHGHEDHQGALPFALQQFPVPVYATPMTHGLAKERLQEYGVAADVRNFEPGARWQMGPFEIEAIHVTHSLVDSVGLAIRTPLGVVIHSGDFKIDHTPVDGRPPDLVRFAQYGEEGVLLLLSDSTNAEVPGVTPSERAIRGPLEEVFRGTTGRIFFSTFASHIHRLAQVIDLSVAYGRRVAVIGRSMLNSIKVATQLGYLAYPASVFVDPSELSGLEPEEQTLLTTGSQGEATSALIRIAEGALPHVKMERGDTVVLSSRIIPGNERQVSHLVNQVLRRGAEAVHSHNAAVHVSGHASQEELKLLLRLVRPRYFVPIHGEYRHLVAHRRLALEVGIPEDRAFLLEDGNVLQIDANGARLAEPVPIGRVFVDGRAVGDVADVVLRDRRHLSSDGLVLAVLALDQQTGAIVAGPDLVSRGFVPEEAADGYLERARQLVRETVEILPEETRRDVHEVQEEVRRTLRRFFARTLDRRPVIIPYVLEM